MEALEIFKSIATIVGCISACIALAITIIKPLRQRLIDSFIRKTKDNKRDVIFITDDKKEDWWNICKGRTIGPRVELIKEFSDITNQECYITISDKVNFCIIMDVYVITYRCITIESALQKNLAFSVFQHYFKLVIYHCDISCSDIAVH